MTDTACLIESDAAHRFVEVGGRRLCLTHLHEAVASQRRPSKRRRRVVRTTTECPPAPAPTRPRTMSETTTLVEDVVDRYNREGFVEDLSMKPRPAETDPLTLAHERIARNTGEPPRPTLPAALLESLGRRFGTEPEAATADTPTLREWLRRAVTGR